MDRLYTADATNTPPVDVDLANCLATLATIRSTPTLSTDAAIDLYLALVCRLTGVSTAFVSQLTPQTMEVRAVRNEADGLLRVGSILLLEESFCQHVWVTRAAVVVPDTTCDPRVVDLVSRQQFAIGAYLGVPVLLRDGAVYGSLCALDAAAQCFTQLQIDLLRIIAQDIALVIEREATEEPSPPPAATAPHAADVFRMVVHDLRTPLAGLMGYADLFAVGGFGAISAEQHAALTEMQTAMQFMHRLVNDLVDVAAVETQQLLVVREAFAPAQVVTQVVALCQVQAAQQGLTLTALLAEAPASMTGDRERLRQVLLNLLSNALRYTVSGGIQIDITQDDDMVAFRVIDSGPGIPADVLPHIWQQQIRGAAEGVGLGLGLYIVRQLVTAMGGTVAVQSMPGSGCCFVVRLPLVGPPPHQLAWASE